MKKETPKTANTPKRTDNASKVWEQLTKEADQEKKTRKPGSQSNSSDQHNNGRGGGK